MYVSVGLSLFLLLFTLLCHMPFSCNTMCCTSPISEWELSSCFFGMAPEGIPLWGFTLFNQSSVSEHLGFSQYLRYYNETLNFKHRFTYLLAHMYGVQWTWASFVRLVNQHMRWKSHRVKTTLKIPFGRLIYRVFIIPAEPVCLFVLQWKSIAESLAQHQMNRWACGHQPCWRHTCVFKHQNHSEMLTLWEVHGEWDLLRK